jgi:hypothetical protein
MNSKKKDDVAFVSSRINLSHPPLNLLLRLHYIYFDIIEKLRIQVKAKRLVSVDDDTK